MNDKLSYLFKMNPIKGTFSHFYHVDINDAEEILRLRTEDRKDNHLMPTTNSLLEQKEYLKRYQKKFEMREEIYFKILDVNKQKFMGFVRLTNIQSKENFSWESAVLDKSSSPNLFIDLMLIIYKIGFEYFEREICGPWKVDKKFKKMMKIHSIIGMTEIIKEDDIFYELVVKKSSYLKKVSYYNKRGLGNIFNIK